MKKPTTLIYIVCALLVVVLCVFGYRAWEKGGVGSEAPAEARPMGALPQVPGGAPYERTIPVGMKIYKSEPFRFSLLVPESMSVQEYVESGDAKTLVFEGGEGQGFQLYITPYGKDFIDTERFRLDEPSGSIENQKDIHVDGVKAVSFEGHDAVIGGTSEVWFIREGLLYEAMAPSASSQWLTQVLASWQFMK